MFSARYHCSVVLFRDGKLLRPWGLQVHQLCQLWTASTALVSQSQGWSANIQSHIAYVYPRQQCKMTITPRQPGHSFLKYLINTCRFSMTLGVIGYGMWHNWKIVWRMKKRKGTCIGHCHWLVENRKDVEGGDGVGEEDKWCIFDGVWGGATERGGQVRYPY